MIANPLRGEVVLVMDDQEHVLRLNLAALMQLEQMLGEDSLVSMVQRFENNAYTSRDVMRVLLRGFGGADGKDAPKHWHRPTFRAALLPPHGLPRSCWCAPLIPRRQVPDGMAAIVADRVGPAHPPDMFWS